MTYAEFQALPLDVIARLEKLKLPAWLDGKVEIHYSRKKRLGRLYFVAVIAEEFGQFDFTPAPKPVPKPVSKPVPKPEPKPEPKAEPVVYKDRETIVPLPNEDPIPVTWKAGIKMSKDEVSDDGEET